jgi:hypothetical protein
MAVSVLDAAAQNAGMGASFDTISSRAVEITTTFRDAYATTKKKADGQLETTLFDLKGRRLAGLKRDPQKPWADVAAEGARWQHRVALDKDMSYATDWNNVQVWLLWRDFKAGRHDLSASTIPAVVLDGRLLRVKSVRDAEKRNKKELDVDDETSAVETVYPEYRALATKREDRKNLQPGGLYATFTARLQAADGTTLGYIRFFKKERIVSWTFTTGERGIAREERVKGGFKFTPNMAWANVQAVRFHEHPPEKPLTPALAATIASCAASVPSLRPKSPEPARPARASIGERIRSLFAVVRLLPALPPRSSGPSMFLRATSLFPFGSGAVAAYSSARATEQQPCDGISDGCTGMHWLDGSLFRPCCDQHDLCFEKDCSNPCTKWSWLKVWDRWECTACNIQAVLCFATGGGTTGGGGEGGGGGGGGDGRYCWTDLDCPDGYMCEWNGRCGSWFR